MYDRKARDTTIRRNNTTIRPFYTLTLSTPRNRLPATTREKIRILQL